MATREELALNARINLGKSFFDLEPSAVIELYEFYFSADEQPFRFHAGTNNLLKNIIWNGNSYFACSVDVEGFEANMIGRLPRPKITIANTDFIISNILRDYSDFRNSKFVRIKLFLKNLDDVNFDNAENPFGVADPMAYISKEKYIISQKIVENKQFVQLELITPFDLQSLETATRAIYGRYCYWQYRGSGCNYQGDLICKENDEDFEIPPSRSRQQFLRNEVGFLKNSNYLDTIQEFKWTISRRYADGDIVFLENKDLNGFKDPPRTFYVCKKAHSSTKFTSPSKNLDFWEKDGCSKTINACKKRFSNNKYISKTKSYTSFNDTDVMNGILPFGGFPGTDRFQYEP
jgi:lambda family phage minor tail protein L